MSNTGPLHPDNRVGRPGSTPSVPDLGLEELMTRIRLELTGSSAALSHVTSSEDEVPVMHAKAAERIAEPDASELSIEEVMARVRLELERRRGASPDASAVSVKASPALGRLPLWRPSAAPLPAQSTYVLADLLRFSDGDFVDNAFRIVLRRPAGAQERAHYLAALRSGGVGKVEMLGNIRFSDEGKKNCVHVDGLLLPYKLHRWQRIPVFGSFLTVANTIFRLPRLLAHLQRMEALGAQESHELGMALNELTRAVEIHQASVKAEIEGRADREDARALTAALSRLRDLLGTQAAKLTQVALADHQTREAIGLIEGKLKEQSSTHAEMEARLQAQLANEVQALTRASSRLQEQLETQASKLLQIEHVDRETRDAVDLVESRLAEQSDAHAGLEQQIQSQVSEEVRALLQVTAQLREQLAAQASTLAQLEVSGVVAEQAIGGIAARLDGAMTREAELSARLDSGLADQAKARAQLEQRVETQVPAVAKLAGASAENRRCVRDIERRLMAFFDHTNRQITEAQPAGLGPVQGEAGLLDAHYVSLEDTFRGTREDIKTRAGHYLESFSEAGIGKEDGLVLDLGCGRGEWLEVLTENGYPCRGVDLNSVMVSETLALGFDAVECDAVAYLRSLENESVSAVTSMHLVEHIPYQVLITLIDEALRVLQPGGVLILETPNPENLTVGSYWFYMDPTHRNPIPPVLLQWIVQVRGFENAVIDRLTQNRGVLDIQPVDDDVAAASQINKIVGLLTAAPDYAIVARKPELSVTQLQES